MAGKASNDHIDWAEEETSESWAEEIDDQPLPPLKSAWSKVPRNDDAAALDSKLLEEFPSVSETAPTQGRRTKHSSESRSYERSAQNQRSYKSDSNHDGRDNSFDDRRREENRSGYHDDRRGRNYDDRYSRSSRSDNRRDDYRSDNRRDDYRRDDYRRDDYRRGDDHRRERDNRRDEPREPRPATPFPTEAPWTAYVGNIPFQTGNEELEAFFNESKCKVETLRLVTDKTTGKPKGYGYIEFKDADSLRSALELNDMLFDGRAIRIDVAGKRIERGDRPSNSRYASDDTVSNWRTDRPVQPPRRSSRERDDASRRLSKDRYDSRYHARNRDDHSSAKERESSQSPRVEDDTKENEIKEEEEAKPKKEKKQVPNPFGDAKPRDELKVIEKLEELRVKQEKEEDVTKKSEEDNAPQTKPKEATTREEEGKKKVETKKQAPAQQSATAAGSWRTERKAPQKNNRRENSKRGDARRNNNNNNNANGNKKDTNRPRHESTTTTKRTGEGNAPKRAKDNQKSKVAERTAPAKVSNANAFALLGEEEA